MCCAGATLKANGESVTWDPEIKDEYPCNFKLIVRQILLGREAKEGEYNVVQVRPLDCIVCVNMLTHTPFTRIRRTGGDDVAA